MTRIMIGMKATITNNKQKRSKSLLSHRVKFLSGSNNSSVTCDFINKGDCNWVYYMRALSCKGYRSKNHGLSGYTKGKKN